MTTKYQHVDITRVREMAARLQEQGHHVSKVVLSEQWGQPSYFYYKRKYVRGL